MANVQLWAIAMVGAVAFAAAGHLLIKAGLNSVSPMIGSVSLSDRLLHYLVVPKTLLGLAIYVLGTVMWVFAVSRREISYLYPLTALNYAVVALGGRLFFSEKISNARWTGIMIVVVGVVLMQWSTQQRTK